MTWKAELEVLQSIATSLKTESILDEDGVEQLPFLHLHFIQPESHWTTVVRTRCSRMFLVLFLTFQWSRQVTRTLFIFHGYYTYVPTMPKAENKVGLDCKYRT